MNQRALDLSVILRGHLASLGSAARSLSVHEFASWTLVRIDVATDEALAALAEDLGLEEARIQRQPRHRFWWREALSRIDGLLIVGVGPYHAGRPPPGAGMTQPRQPGRRPSSAQSAAARHAAIVALGPQVVALETRRSR